MLGARWIAPALVAAFSVMAACADVGAAGSASSQDAISTPVGVRRATPASFAPGSRAAPRASAARARGFDGRAPDAVRSPLLRAAAPSAPPSLGDSFFFPPPPQLLTGGPDFVLAEPMVIPVYFAGQPFIDQMQAFFEKLGTSA